MKNLLPLAIVLAFSFALAQPHFQHGKNIKSEFPELELTETQESEIENLKYQFEVKRIDFSADLEKAELDLQQLFSDENPDRVNIESQIRKISDIKVEMKLFIMNHCFDVRELLTDEQQEIFDAKRKKHRMGRRHKRQEAGHKGHGWFDHQGHGGGHERMKHKGNFPFPCHEYEDDQSVAPCSHRGPCGSSVSEPKK